jgi:hypothetical protein
MSKIGTVVEGMVSIDVVDRATGPVSVHPRRVTAIANAVAARCHRKLIDSSR